MSDSPDTEARLARIKAYVTDPVRLTEWQDAHDQSQAFAAVLQAVADLCDLPAEVAEERALTREEQGMLHRALRRSLRIVGSDEVAGASLEHG